MQSLKFSYSKLLIAAFLVVMVTEIVADCPASPGGERPACAARRGQNGVLENATCWEPGGYTSLFCDYANTMDFPNRNIYDVSFCQRKSCSGNADCGRKGTCTDGECVVTNDNYLLGARCEYNCDCVGPRVCRMDSCLGEKVCKAMLAHKEYSLCEVTYTTNKPTENWSCLSGTECVSAPAEETSIPHVATIKRCDLISCETDSDCPVGVCAGPQSEKVCDPNPVDLPTGMFSVFFASACQNNQDCIGDYVCCKDPELDGYGQSKLCMSKEECKKKLCD